MQHLVYERPEADKRAAVSRLCRATRSQPKQAQRRVGVDGRRLRVAVRARPHARGQLNRAAELVLVSDEGRVLGPCCGQTRASRPGCQVLNYSILLMVVVSLAFAMVACGLLKTR